MKKIILLFIMLTNMIALKAQYNVGDIYDKDGLKGLIVRVDESGQHGLIMSLDRCDAKWYSDKKAKFATNSFYEDDGQKNMEAIQQYITETNSSWDKFPFFAWCKNKGEGWYAPASDEMASIIKLLNGSIGSYHEDSFKKIDTIIKNNGGESLYGTTELPMGGKMPYHMWTSTECDKGKVFALGTMQTSPFGVPTVKFYEVKKTHSRYLGSRAVHKF